MPSLSAQERVELQQAVSVHGRDWRAMAAAGACGGRAEDALRKAWDKLSAVGIAAAAEVVAEPVLSPLTTGPALLQALPEPLVNRFSSAARRGLALLRDF